MALLTLAGCGFPAPTLYRGSSVPPAPARAATPVSLSQRVRQDGWLTRFWEQLTPAQRRRVLARLRAADPPYARTEGEAAPVWDALGLPDRNALVFGTGLPSRGG